MSFSKIYIVLSIVILLMLNGCTDFNNSDCLINEFENNQLIWVAKLYVGGKQCDTTIYTPPDIKILFMEYGVEVFEIHIERYAVCRACGCPQYAGSHYALIKKKHFKIAEKLGFEQKNPFRN